MVCLIDPAARNKSQHLRIPASKEAVERRRDIRRLRRLASNVALPADITGADAGEHYYLALEPSRRRPAAMAYSRRFLLIHFGRPISPICRVDAEAQRCQSFGEPSGWGVDTRIGAFDASIGHIADAIALDWWRSLHPARRRMLARLSVN